MNCFELVILLGVFLCSNALPTKRICVINRRFILQGNVRTIDNIDMFDRIRKENGRPYVINFSKTSCKPCLKLAPAYEKLAEDLADKVDFYKIDADTFGFWATSVFKKEGIRSTPTCKVYCRGDSVDKVNNMDDLEDTVNGVLRQVDMAP